MPGRLTVAQWLTRPDGLPTAAARSGVACLVLIAAASGYAAGPRGGERYPPSHGPVAAGSLTGELPIAASKPEPALEDAVAVPPLPEPTPKPRSTPAPTFDSSG